MRTSVPLFNPPSLPTGAGAGPYVQLYTPTNKTLPAYTSDPKSSAYTGGLLDLLQAARLTDVNALRVAYENLRVMSEALAAQHNQLIGDLKAMGMIS